MIKLPEEAYAIVEGRHADPFHYLGPHEVDNKTIVRAFLPEATNVDAIDGIDEAAVAPNAVSCGLSVSEVSSPPASLVNWAVGVVPAALCF